MILISPDVLLRLRHENANNAINESILSSLDRDMHRILRSNLSDREKWTSYQQVLQRYLHFAQELKQPVILPVVQSVEKTQNVEENLNTEYILSSIPKTFRTKAQLLIDSIKHNVTWDDKGVVYIDGHAIRGSNVIDLISDVIRPRKHSNPTGWEEFAKYLKGLNIPREYIGNDRRWTFIHNQDLVDSPVKENKSLDWETFFQ